MEIATLVSHELHIWHVCWHIPDLFVVVDTLLILLLAGRQMIIDGKTIVLAHFWGRLQTCAIVAADHFLCIIVALTLKQPLIELQILLFCSPDHSNAPSFHLILQIITNLNHMLI